MVRQGLLNRYMGYLNCGCNLGSKLRLAIILIFTNHIVLSKVPRSVRKILIRISNWLSRGVTTNIHGLKFKMQDYECCYVCTPLFEDWSWDLYQKIKKGDVFVDVGAHVGRYTLPVARAVGEQGLVIAVEADIENYNCLRENIECNNVHNVITINVAAWSDNRKLKFYRGDLSSRGSTKIKTGNAYIEVNGRRLDSLLEEVGVMTRVNWIKIDVEGDELEVLKGLHKTLLRGSPQLLVEISGENRNEFEHYMNGLNYKCRLIPDSEVRRENAIYYCCWRSEGAGKGDSK